MNDHHLTRYCRFFETLQTDSLQVLPELFTAQAIFRDPFNHVQGHAAIRRIFEHLLADHPRCIFVVKETLQQDAIAYIRWDFSPDSDGDLTIDGVSRVVFETTGKVSEHRDYWDSASELFGRLPWIGPPTRWLLRQAQANRNDQIDELTATA